MNLDNLPWKEYGYITELRKLRPKLNVEIIHGGRRVPVLGLLDSGGDCTIINAEFASVLGIDLTKCPTENIGGIDASNEMIGYIAEVRISLEGFEEELPIKAKFVEGMRTDVILGQNDIFEHFIAVFDRKKHKFYLSRNH